VNPTRGIPGGPVYLAQTSFLLLLLFSFWMQVERPNLFYIHKTYIGDKTKILLVYLYKKNSSRTHEFKFLGQKYILVKAW
jgi:hypothetical protein